MIGITSPEETYDLKQCLIDIYNASKEKPIYSEVEKLALIRYSTLKRRFTEYEANVIYLIHARIPRKPKSKDDPQPWMSKKRKQNFYEVKT